MSSARVRSAVVQAVCLLVLSGWVGTAAAADRIAVVADSSVGLADAPSLSELSPVGAPWTFQPSLDSTGRYMVYTNGSPYSYASAIYFTDLQSGAVSTPFVADVDPETEERIEAVNHPKLSADGQWILYTYWPDYDGMTSTPGEAEIRRMRPNGSDRQQVVDWDGDQQWASYSPDGSRLVFLSTHDTEGDPIYSSPPPKYLGQLFVADGDGSDPEQLLSGPLKDTGNPSFSPDGERLVFHATPTGLAQGPRIWVVNSDGSNLTAVDDDIYFDTPSGPNWCLTDGGVYPSWSPDGKKVIYEGAQYCPAIVRAAADGSEHRVVHAPERDGGHRRYFPQYRPAAPFEELAHRFRPNLLLDEGEHWSPIDVYSFFGEGGHQLCVPGPTCTPVTSVADLTGYPGTDAYLDIAGSGSADNFKSPDLDCIDGDIWECDRGPAAAAYWHASAESPGGYRYLDYWFFYRYNDHAPTFDHEADWESVTVAPASSGETFDFVSFSAHGKWWSYLRDHLRCDEGPSAGSCGDEEDKEGERVSAFAAAGGHSNYGEPCTGICTQTNSILPETQHGGERPWAANSDPATLSPLPPTAAPLQPWINGPATFTDWPGIWGADDDIGGPATRGNAAHFAAPWDIDGCATDPCEYEDSLLSARAAQTSGCGSWFGANVVALACDPRELRDALSRQGLGEPGTFTIEDPRGISREDSAPGLSQVVGQPLRPGDEIQVRGQAGNDTRLRVRVRAGADRLLIAEFADLDLDSPSTRATLRVSGDATARKAGKPPEVVVRYPDGTREAPDHTRLLKR